MTVQTAPRRNELQPWLALAGAAGCFLVVSAASADPGPLVRTVVAIGLAVLGSGLTGHWARRVGRRTHAAAALSLWCFGLVVSGVQIVQPSGGATASVGTILLWTIALLAGVTTLYLGLREYGSTVHQIGAESVVEGDI